MLSDKWKSCALQGVTDRSQEVEVEAVCEQVPKFAENTYSAVPVTFQSHNRKPLKLENYTCSLFENKLSKFPLTSFLTHNRLRSHYVHSIITHTV
jgi:hypothetical protein